MIERALENKKASLSLKITVKTAVSAGLVALAVVLPQIAHLAVGVKAGVLLLPMYLPVLLAGCLLGPAWGLGVGMLSPVVSYLITAAFGDPMPALARLPFMTAELGVFALVSGLFSKKIEENAYAAFPAVLFAGLAGRTFFLSATAVFQKVSPLSPAVVWGQIQTGFLGLLLQAAVVPLLVIGLRRLLLKEKNQQ